ncbi:MAG: DUF1857 family protein [bacterium]|nr:DUF1857 family protein [bacterium]
MENTIHHSETVQAPLQKVWEHLLYKIDHPENFVPGVSNVKILEKSADATLRKMDLTMPVGTNSVTEKITATPYCVRFQIIEHPLVKGYVENYAKALNEHSTLLTYVMNWEFRENRQTANNSDLLKSAVIKSKNYIEGIHL